ncbi:GNAT family N-acetyltransferase [Sneathiella sp.]|jgi:putative hemolysin|uniref:GNAT family N-acetyltransferase n=1 Tax=Sneathiella sp. TaxID=1964365 RepID=UPI0039E215F1
MDSRTVSTLTIGLATTREEITRAQELRYRVFYQDMGASPSASITVLGRDYDAFDDICDHLIVIDKARSWAGRSCVVGTYRMLRKSVAIRHGGFYSENEFNLGKLDRYPGEMVELGRSCVDPQYRGKAIMQLLWQGIADYIAAHGISLLFGCASFPGTDLSQMSSALSFLHYKNRAPVDWRPKACGSGYVAMDILEEEQIDFRTAMREMPALIKGYLRVGGVIGDGAVKDDVFNTTDVCLLVETSNITGKYQRHFLENKASERMQLTA